MYMCVRKCHWGPERTSDPLELELQVTVSHLMWVLGTKSLSPGRAAAHALNHQYMLLTISPALSFITRTQATLIYLMSFSTSLALFCVSSTWCCCY